MLKVADRLYALQIDQIADTSAPWSLQHIDNLMAMALPPRIITGSTVEIDPTSQELLECIDRRILSIHREAILRNACMACWASFEVFAGDLWSSVMKGHRALAARFLRAEGYDQLADVIAKSNRAVDHGAVLQEIGLARFATFAGIYETYERTFGKSDDLKALLVASKNKDLFELAQTRHAIMHAGGRADEEYIKKLGAANIKPRMRSDGLIDIDCALVIGFMNNTANTAWALAGFVESNASAVIDDVTT